MYDAAKHVILDQTHMTVLGERIDRHTNRYFEAIKVAEAFEEWLLLKNRLPAPRISFAPLKPMEKVNGQQKVGKFRATFMATLSQSTTSLQHRSYMCKRHRLVRPSKSLAKE